LGLFPNGCHFLEEDLPEEVCHRIEARQQRNDGELWLPLILVSLEK
jgi:hypothetical protein